MSPTQNNCYYISTEYNNFHVNHYIIAVRIDPK